MLRSLGRYNRPAGSDSRPHLNTCLAMSHDLEYIDEFESWWNGLTAEEQEDVRFVVRLLDERGTQLGDPYSSQVLTSRHGRMRELRIQSGGRPIRIFYAFDPRRTAILLIGGHKTDNRFYREYVRRADVIYDEYLQQLRREGLLSPERGRRR